jgi:hypothetical protein
MIEMPPIPDFLKVGAHSPLGASASERWINCPGSIRMQEGITDRESVYAREGSAAHALAEHCLAESQDAAEFIGSHVFEHKRKWLVAEGPASEDSDFDVTDEMAEAVQTYLDFVRNLIEEGDEWSAEQSFHLKDFHRQFYGTCDLVVYKPEKGELHVADYKHGKGVAVEVEGNPQLRYYALGAATRHHNRGVRKVVIYVVQPRCPHNDGPIRSETITPVDLLEWSADLVDAAEATAKPDAPLVAGDWCKFCRAAAICPEYKARALAVAQAEFDDEADGGGLNLPDPKKLDAEARGKVLREADMLENWIKAVRQHAHDLALLGDIPADFKLVNTRPVRVWKDEDRLRALLAEDVMMSPADMLSEPKLRSPAQMETTLAKSYGFKKKDAVELLAPLIDSVSKNTVLVPLSDKRPPSRAAAADEFEAAE